MKKLDGAVNKENMGCSSKILKGKTNEFRLRVGEWRVRFELIL